MLAGGRGRPTSACGGCVPVLVARLLAAGSARAATPVGPDAPAALDARPRAAALAAAGAHRVALLAPYLRLLGARVGRPTTSPPADLTLPRMLHLDDDATVGYGAALHPWSVEDGQVVVGAVRLDRRAVVGANTVLGPGSRIGAAGMLREQSGAGP